MQPPVLSGPWRYFLFTKFSNFSLHFIVYVDLNSHIFIIIYILISSLVKPAKPLGLSQQFSSHTRGVLAFAATWGVLSLVLLQIASKRFSLHVCFPPMLYYSNGRGVYYTQTMILFIE